MTKRHGWLIFLFLLIASAIQLSPVSAQADCALPTRLTINMPGRVRAVTSAGNNLRAEAGLNAEIIGELPNESEFTVLSEPLCMDGINWYQIRTLDEQRGWTAEGLDGLYWLEPTPFCTPLQREQNVVHQFTEETNSIFDNIVDIIYNSAQHSLLISTLPPSFQRSYSPPHPAVLDYHWLNLETQQITQAEYPNADIVTRELTDRLGITDDVFGEHSNELYSLHVSPQRDRILYFVDNPPIEECAHGCYTEQVWLADTNGSNAIEVGTIINGEVGYIEWEWGTNGHIYLTMIYVGPSYDVIDICEDGSCYTRNTFPFPYAFPSVSPDGEIIAVLNNGDGMAFLVPQTLFIDDTQIELPILSWLAPLQWSEDGQTLYYLTGTNTPSIARVPLADLENGETIVTAVNLTRTGWGVVEDYGLAFSHDRFDGFQIHCLSPED